MNAAGPTMSAETINEINALIEVLRKANLRLDELTAGQVDTVADRDGQTFLLQRTQDRLRFKDAEKQGAILNAMPAQVALLADNPPSGTIVMHVDVTPARKASESQRAKEEILRLNADLESQLAERTSALEAANRELEAFDYSIAHDLRAPIRHIEGFTTMLLEDYGEQLDARGRQCLEKVQSAGKRMELMVGDLLALSLVSRSKLDRSDIDASALAQLVFANLHEAEPAREIECVVGPSLRVNADLGLLRIVLENLIGNAWKFTGKQAVARIEFGCILQDNVPTFFVRDNGAGFDQSYADRLFAPFQRLHSQSEFKGTGIGLATVSRVITRHGGKVWAEGVVDQGATFHFTLPI